MGICSDFKTFYFEIDNLKTILVKNNYPLTFIDSCIKSFLSTLYKPDVMVPNVPKRNIFVKVPFLGSTLFQIRNKLLKLFNDKLTSSNLKTVLHHPLESEPSSLSRISYLRCYIQDFFTSVNVVAAILLIMKKPNAILTFEFLNM